jgi:Ca2+-binding EF-hand superfamily protein
MIKSIMQGAFVLALAASPALANESYEPSSARFSPSEVEAIFEEADRDKDGALSQDEFDQAATLLGETPETLPSS